MAALPDAGRYAKLSVWQDLHSARPEGLEPPTLGSEEAPGQPAKKLESRYRQSAYHEDAGVANRLIPSHEIPRKRGSGGTNPVITGFDFRGFGVGESAERDSPRSDCHNRQPDGLVLQ